MEVLSPDDETYDKLPHYLNCGVTEILVVHPTERCIKIYLNTRSAWEESAASALFRISMKDLAAETTWP